RAFRLSRIPRIFRTLRNHYPNTSWGTALRWNACKAVNSPLRLIVARDFFLPFVALLRLHRHSRDGTGLEPGERDRLARNFAIVITPEDAGRRIDGTLPQNGPIVGRGRRDKQGDCGGRKQVGGGCNRRPIRDLS